ncbi:MAG: TonB-dependent receptor [candidate division Zixibacteria bacterium]|nr:TonB-dependent receptor [candidate division Zixibacteria bacterium]
MSKQQSRGIVLSIILITTLISTFAYAGQEIVHGVDDVIVTAGRIPMSFSEITRSVTVISSEEIVNAPVHSIQDLLEYIPGVDINKRGAHGVQADISIRGGTFEQTLVLVDGVKVSDPQTGHHNLNLPITLDDVKRIEVLRGQGSGLYGPNAFGGVVNIITRKGAEKQLIVKAIAGDFEFSETAASLSHPIGDLGNHLSISRKKSGGYTEATDFEIMTAHYGSSIHTYAGDINLSLGYIDKKFGANRFYSDAFPNEREHTETMMLNIGMRKEFDSMALSSKVYSRRHKDDFILDNDRPDWYRNKHTTDIYGSEIQADFESRLGKTALGGEAGQEKIESSSLGNHSRNRGGIFLEHQATMANRITLHTGAFAYYHSDQDWQVWPSLNIGCQLSDDWRAYGSVGRSFRVPTYTELYYISEANMGNPDLRPEKAITFETGINWGQQFINGNLTAFRREGKDIIDWARSIDSPGDPWQVDNVSTVNTMGLEFSLGAYPDQLGLAVPITRLQGSYVFLDSDKKTEGYESKYLLRQIDHQFLIDIEHALPFNLIQGWKFRYEVPTETDSRFIVDTRVSWRHSQLEWFIEATNLFDESYFEIGTIPMPGRQVLAGVKWDLLGDK